jgi:uncharacterized membrane protein
MGRDFLSRWALPASLAFNVFLGTVLVMREAGPPHRPPPGGPHGPLGIVERMAEELPAADAAILRRSVAKRSQEIEYQWRVWNGTPERATTLLAAPSLDADALRAALDEGRNAHAAVDVAVTEVIMEAATAMSPEGRHAVARWRPPGPPRRGPGGPDGGPPPPPR